MLSLAPPVMAGLVVHRYSLPADVAGAYSGTGTAAVGDDGILVGLTELSQCGWTNCPGQPELYVP